MRKIITDSFSAQGKSLLQPLPGYEMQLALRLVYDINEDLQKLLVQHLEILFESVSELVDWYSDFFLNFRSSFMRHTQMNLWFYSLIELDEGGETWTFWQHVFLQLHELVFQEQCIVGHQEEFVLTGATGTPWCVLYIVPVVLTCLLEVLQLSWWSFAHLAVLFKLGLLRNVKKKCGLQLVKKGSRNCLCFLAPSWNMWCSMCCNLYILQKGNTVKVVSEHQIHGLVIWER